MTAESMKFDVPGQARIAAEQGDSVIYMLAFGQFYAATLTEVFADQLGAFGGPTVDLSYGDQGTQSARHVPYNPTAQQPHSWLRHGDAGDPGVVPKPAAPEEPKEPEPAPEDGARAETEDSESAE